MTFSLVAYPQLQMQMHGVTHCAQRLDFVMALLQQAIPMALNLQWPCMPMR